MRHEQTFARQVSPDRLSIIESDVRRLLAKLNSFSDPPHSAATTVNPKESQATLVRTLINQRRARDKFFDSSLFAEPAWDMLLDLYAAHIAQFRVPVSSLCIAAAVPQTTALRWISTLESRGYFRRRSDPTDGRRVFIELTEKAESAMGNYLTSQFTLDD